METPNPVTDPAEANKGYLAMLKSELRSFITDARAGNVEGKLRSRPLSVAITHAEEAYMWLCEVSSEDGRLYF